MRTGVLLLFLSLPVLAQNRSQADAYKKQGDELLAAGKTALALAQYEKALDADPSYVAAYDKAAPLLIDQGQFARAIDRLRLFLTAQPQHGTSWVYLAGAYRKSQKYAEAVEAYERALVIDPADPDPYYGIGLTFRLLGDNLGSRIAFSKYLSLENRTHKQKIVEQTKKELEREPIAKSDVAARDRGLAFLQQNQPEAAIRELEGAVTANPADDYCWYSLAIAYRRIKEFAKAVAAYRKFVVLRPTEADPHYGLGLTYKDMGDRDRARTSFEQYVVMEHSPDKQRFVTQAKTELAGLAPLQASPKDRVAQLLSDATQKRAAGDLAAAEDLTRQALAQDTLHLAARRQLAGVLLEAGKIESAAGELQLVVKQAPQDERAWRDLALALRTVGRPGAAAEAFQSYLRLAPDDTPAYLVLAQALRDAGDVKGARAAFTIYLSREKRASERGRVEQAQADLAALDRGGAARVVVIDNPPAPKSTVIAVGAPTAGAPTQTDAQALLEAGDKAFLEKHYDTAIAAYRQATVRDPQGVESRYRMGVVLAAKGDVARAVEAWEQVLLIQPMHERARKNIEDARRKLPSAPQDLDGEMKRLRALAADGRTTSVIAAVDLLLADPSMASNPDLLALRGTARLDNNDARGALADLQLVLAIDPRRLGAIRGLADAYLVLGDKARAKYFYETFVSRAVGDPAEKELVPVVRKKLEALGK